MRANTGSGHVELESGSEGPREDPYHWTELTVRRGALEVTLHVGLGDWVRVNGADLESLDPERAFADLVGYTPRQLEGFLQKARSRCRACGGRRLAPTAGYPGETLYICVDCDSVAHASFNRAAVE